MDTKSTASSSALPDTTLSIARTGSYVSNTRALEKMGRDLLAMDSGLSEAMAQLAPLDAYFIIKELGVDEGALLLRHSTQEQLQVCVDLDCWEGDRPALEDLDAWLGALVAENYDNAVESFLRLDSELQVLFLADRLTLWDNADPEEVPDYPDSIQRKITLDQCFAVDIPIDEEHELETFPFLDALYKRSFNEGFRLLSAVNWELSGPLEEQAYQFRCGRLGDFGFPSRVEALTIFAKPSDSHHPIHGTHKRVIGADETDLAPLPKLYQQKGIETTSLFSESLAKITDEENRYWLLLDLRHLIHHAIVAYQSSPRNLMQVENIVERVNSTLSLGLDIIFGAKGEIPLTELSLFNIFRHGHLEVKKLHQSALAITQDPLITHWLTQMDKLHNDSGQAGSEHGQIRADWEFVKHLVDFPPLHAGFDLQQPTLKKAFASRQALTQAQVRLDKIIQPLL